MTEKLAVKVYTMPQLARKFAIHRVTLKRMEDRGDIPKARWIELPGGTKGRIYTEAEALVVKEAVELFRANRRPGDTDGVMISIDRLNSGQIQSDEPETDDADD